MKLNNARNHGESFKAYRKRLKKEQMKLKEYLKGRLIWESSRIGVDPSTKLAIKYVTNGTFVRANKSR